MCKHYCTSIFCQNIYCYFKVSIKFDVFVINQKYMFFRPVLKCSGKTDTWYGKDGHYGEKDGHLQKSLQIEENYNILTICVVPECVLTWFFYKDILKTTNQLICLATWAGEVLVKTGVYIWSEQLVIGE